MIFAKRLATAVAALGAVLTLSSCGGGGKSAVAPSNPITGAASNVATVTVDAGPASNSVNTLYTSIKICAPGSTTNCQTINNIQVDPLSPMDDRSRLQVYRAIYGYPSLNKYAIDPAQPIRITVVNGNVTLNGVVNSQADKDVAGIRANSVPGIFKVTNNLQVANGSKEK